jgi:hypothetical protein
MLGVSVARAREHAPGRVRAGGPDSGAVDDVFVAILTAVVPRPVRSSRNRR